MAGFSDIHNQSGSFNPDKSFVNKVQTAESAAKEVEKEVDKAVKHPFLTALMGNEIGRKKLRDKMWSIEDKQMGILR